MKRLLMMLALIAGSAVQAQAPAPPPEFKAISVKTPDGLAIAAQEWGNPNGPEILFIHGFSQSYLSWTKQVKSDLAKTYRMVTYDLRGHGQSDKPLGDPIYKESKRWGDEVKAVMDAAGLKRPVLVGWSYAGRVIMDYLMTHGEAGIAGVNFVSAGTNGPMNAPAPAGAVIGGMASDDLATNIAATRAFLRMCFSTQPTAEEFEAMVGFNMMTPAAVRRSMFGRPTPYEPTLKSLKLPVLVTHGVEDRAVLVKVGQWTVATVPGSRASFYDWTGHAPFWEAPGRFNKELAEFVSAAQRP